MMKQKMVMCLLAGVLVLGMSGCGAQEVEVPEVENVETAEEEPVPEETAEEEGDEQEKIDAEDQLKEVPTVDDAAESGKPNRKKPKRHLPRWFMRMAVRSPLIPPGLTRITRRSIPVRQCFIKLRRTEKKSW